MSDPVYRGDPARGAWTLTYTVCSQTIHLPFGPPPGRPAVKSHAWGTHGTAAHATAFYLLEHCLRDRSLAALLYRRFTADVVSKLEGCWCLGSVAIIEWAERALGLPVQAEALEGERVVPRG